MKRAFLICLLVTVATLSGCGSGTFTIRHEEFQATDVCDGTGTLEIYLEGGAARAKAQSDVQTHMLKDGMPSIWCHGLTHQFVGTVKMAGYTFESDASEPLQFKVDRNRGYYHISGKGTVTDPSGKVTTLP